MAIWKAIKSFVFKTYSEEFTGTSKLIDLKSKTKGVPWVDTVITTGIMDLNLSGGYLNLSVNHSKGSDGRVTVNTFSGKYVEKDFTASKKFTLKNIYGFGFSFKSSAFSISDGKGLGVTAKIYINDKLAWDSYRDGRGWDRYSYWTTSTPSWHVEGTKNYVIQYSKATTVNVRVEVTRHSSDGGKDSFYGGKYSSSAVSKRALKVFFMAREDKTKK